MRHPELLFFPCSASQNLEESFEKVLETAGQLLCRYNVNLQV